jgi:PEP-CTERM motif
LHNRRRGVVQRLDEVETIVRQVNTIFKHSLLCAGAVLALTSTAHATDIYTGTLTIAATDPTQLGRLSRNGVPQTWAGDEAFPGVINPTLSYAYKALTLDIAALESGYTYGQFLQVTIDSAATTTFLAGYLNTYTPTSAATVQSTWLGDAGTSGLSFGTNPLSFQVKVGNGNKLVLVLNETTPGAGLGLTANIKVEAFADINFTDLSPSPVPEPASWAFMGAGLALLALRRRRAV